MTCYRCFFAIPACDLYQRPQAGEEAEVLYPPHEDSELWWSRILPCKATGIQSNFDSYKNAAIYSEMRLWNLANQKTHPWPSRQVPSPSFAGRGLTWREVADTSAVVQMPLPQNAFCSLLTWISGQAHVHFQIILLSHLSRDPCFHNTRDQFCLYAYNTYVKTAWSCVLEKNTWSLFPLLVSGFLYTAVAPWSSKFPKLSCGTVQEAQPWSELALISFPKV